MLEECGVPESSAPHWASNTGMRGAEKKYRPLRSLLCSCVLSSLFSDRLKLDRLFGAHLVLLPSQGRGCRSQLTHAAQCTAPAHLQAGPGRGSSAMHCVPPLPIVVSLY